MSTMATGTLVSEYPPSSCLSTNFSDLAGAESVGGGASSGSAQRLGKQVTVLQEENNMLKLKVDVLLNLVAETIAELSTAQK
jgi:hypothetical protein